MCVLEGDKEVAFYDLIHGIPIAFVDKWAEAEDELQTPISGQPVVLRFGLSRRVFQDGEPVHGFPIDRRLHDSMACHKHVEWGRHNHREEDAIEVRVCEEQRPRVESSFRRQTPKQLKLQGVVHVAIQPEHT